MQSLFSQQTRWIVATFVSGFLMTASATGVSAGDFGPREDVAGLVETLVASNDLKPAPSVGSPTLASRSGGPVIGSVFGPVASRSTPEVRGAASTRELFSNSKAVVPLLVSDLEPSVISVARPMVGSLVGARPLMPRSRSSASR